MRLLTRAAAALFTTVCLTAVPAMAQSTAGTLKIGVEGAYPPFSSLATDGQLKGFDIDIANEVCKRLKVKCELVKTEFDALIPALNAKKIDAIVASMSITPERLKSVDFTQKYYHTPARFVTKADSKLEVTAAGLKGKKIGVQRGTIHDRFVTATFKDSEIVRYNKQDEVFLDLVSGRVDGTMVDSAAADQGFLKTPPGKGFAFIGPSFTDPTFFGPGAGIAIRKGDKALQGKINAALTAIRADGTHKKFNDAYFEFDIYGAELAKK